MAFNVRENTVFIDEFPPLGRFAPSRWPVEKSWLRHAVNGRITLYFAKISRASGGSAPWAPGKGFAAAPRQGA